MQITVNGETREVPDRITLSDLIAFLKLPAERIAIELNRNVVRRSEWQATVLAADDRVEIVHFVGGG